MSSFRYSSSIASVASRYLITSCVAVLGLIIISFTCYPASILASSSANTLEREPIKTQTNDITDEFDQIEDRRATEAEVQGFREQGAAGVGSTDLSNILSEEDLAKMESEKNSLSGIDENAMESRGRDERSKPENVYFNEFETDYTKPGAIAHKNYAEKLAEKTDKKLGDLSTSLQKYGINCKQEDKAAAAPAEKIFFSNVLDRAGLFLGLNL